MAGVSSDQIRIHIGHSQRLLPSWPAARFSAVFMDQRGSRYEEDRCSKRLGSRLEWERMLDDARKGLEVLRLTIYNVLLAELEIISLEV